MGRSCASSATTRCKPIPWTALLGRIVRARRPELCHAQQTTRPGRNLRAAAVLHHAAAKYVQKTQASPHPLNSSYVTTPRGQVELEELLVRVDAFIEEELASPQADGRGFFDHRREFPGIGLERGGALARAWEGPLIEMMLRADGAGLYRCALPAELGGSEARNLEIAAIREQQGGQTVGQHPERACVGNLTLVLMLHAFGSREPHGRIERLLHREPALASRKIWTISMPSGRRPGHRWQRCHPHVICRLAFERYSPGANVGARKSRCAY
jgi:hypothetical protein